MGTLLMIWLRPRPIKTISPHWESYVLWILTIDSFTVSQLLQSSPLPPTRMYWVKSLPLLHLLYGSLPAWNMSCQCLHVREAITWIWSCSSETLCPCFVRQNLPHLTYLHSTSTVCSKVLGALFQRSEDCLTWVIKAMYIRGGRCLKWMIISESDPPRPISL